MDLVDYNASQQSTPDVERIRTVLTRFPAISAGYLFGSTATGKQGPLSDIDVAVLVSNAGSSGDIVGEVHDALSRELRTNRLDLVSLDAAPASLAYRIIRDGRCIYCRDEQCRLNFMTRTIMRYLDFKPVRDRAFQLLRRKTLEAA